MSARARATAILALAPAAIALVALLRSLSTFATVRGVSMSPTFTDGERVFALRRRCYRAGDVIVFRPSWLPPSCAGLQWRIKRVVATSGDPVPGWLRDCEWSATSAASHVPHAHVVVSGDNPRSEDSRHLGFVPIAAVAGRVFPARQSTASGTSTVPRTMRLQEEEDAAASSRSCSADPPLPVRLAQGSQRRSATGRG